MNKSLGGFECLICGGLDALEMEHTCSSTPTREEDLARLHELLEERPTCWIGAMDQSIEIDKILLRAIEWWGKDRWI